MRVQDSHTYINDLDIAIEHSIGIEGLAGSTVMVTGATGTIGSFIADMFLRANQTIGLGINVVVTSRNLDKLIEQYSFWNDKNLSFFEYDMFKDISFDVSVDYVVHAAGNAHPTTFNRDPVGTIWGNIKGTYNLLEYCKSCKGKRFLYVSSGEVYGQGDLSVEEFEEKYAGYIDILSPRSCYPSSKRAVENLCASYYSQYGLETLIVRPCHTYGPGITMTDSRANAQFFRNVLNGEDIVMKSAGTQLRSYNYVADCASAILTVLFNGEAGQAYNIANPKVRITIAQLADIIAKKSGRKVVFVNPSDTDIINRTPIVKQVLCSKKLEDLGWIEAFSADLGIENTLAILQGK